jgi:stage III sporulation protein AA
MTLSPVFLIIPPPLREWIQALPQQVLRSLEEIRVRQDRPLELIASGESWYVGRERRLSRNPEEALSVTREDCLRMLNLITDHSLYALEEELRRGYVTVAGGHRVGLAGRVVTEQGRVRHLREITCFNVRIARQVPGVAEPLLPYVMPGGEPESVLIISPPQCGKTTLIRDLARLASSGGKHRPSRKVGIVDERSEIAGCVRGVPTHDVGPRTDVLDGCPKAEGMMMMIRAMSPEILVVDELGGAEDCVAVREALHAGVRLFATAHGGSPDEIRRRPALSELVEQGAFGRLILLSRRLGPGTVEAIYDRELRPLRTAALPPPRSGAVSG